MLTRSGKKPTIDTDLPREVSDHIMIKLEQLYNDELIENNNRRIVLQTVETPPFNDADETDDTFVIDTKNEIDTDDDDDEDDEENSIDPFIEADFNIFKNDVLMGVETSLTQNELENVENALAETLEKLKTKYADLFQTVFPAKFNREHWKIGISAEIIEKIEPKLNKIFDDIESYRSKVCEVGIMQSFMTPTNKKECILLLERMRNCPEYSSEYFDYEKDIIKKLIESEKYKENEGEQLEVFCNSLKDINCKHLTLLYKIYEARSYIEQDKLAFIYEKYQEYIESPSDGETRPTLINWIENVLRLPFNRQLNSEITFDKILRVKEILDKNIYGMDHVKEQIMCILHNRMKNPQQGGHFTIALYGSPGTGKTVIAKSLADAMNLPFQHISLGGLQDATVLKGQHIGWVGACPGRIVKCLQQMKYNNGIIFLDEADKIGQTGHGKDVQSVLLDLLEFPQNKEFVDNFVGHELPIDLSNIIWVIAMNDPRQVDQAVLSRMPLIHIPDYSQKDKLTIIHKHLVPIICEQLKLDPSLFVLDDITCRHIIDTNNEGGVRNIRDILSFILSKVSLLYGMKLMSENKISISGLTEVSFPLILTPDIVDKFYIKEKDTMNKWIMNSMYT
jgi:ATP-dependent Lon protease